MGSAECGLFFCRGLGFAVEGLGLRFGIWGLGYISFLSQGAGSPGKYYYIVLIFANKNHNTEGSSWKTSNANAQENFPGYSRNPFVVRCVDN